MNFSAVILAGGKSSRMGRDKAFLKVDGTTLLAQQIDLAHETGAEEVFISGRKDADYSMFDASVLFDQTADAGPLAGIERALAVCASSLLLVMAVDMPGLTQAFLRKLAQSCADNLGAVPRVDGNIEPLTAFYPKTALPLLKNLPGGNSYSVKAFAEECSGKGLVAFVDLPQGDTKFFTNWNSPNQVTTAPRRDKIAYLRRLGP